MEQRLVAFFPPKSRDILVYNEHYSLMSVGSYISISQSQSNRADSTTAPCWILWWLLLLWISTQFLFVLFQTNITGSVQCTTYCEQEDTYIYPWKNLPDTRLLEQGQMLSLQSVSFHTSICVCVSVCYCRQHY